MARPTSGDGIVYIDYEETVLVFSVAPQGQPRGDYVFVRGFSGRTPNAQAIEVLMDEGDVLAVQELLKTFLAKQAEKKLAQTMSEVHPEDEDAERFHDL